MLLLGLLVKFVIMDHVIASLYEVARDCTQTPCLVLYASNDTAGVTWRHSKSVCEETGQTLAAVYDVITQRRIQAWLGRIHTRALDGVWVGGSRQRTDEGHWQYLNGSRFEGGPEYTFGQFCLYASLLQGPVYTDVTCAGGDVNRTVVCQYPPQTDGSCSQCLGCHEAFNYRDVCYVMTTYTAQTWYAAIDVCVEQYAGTLVYSHLDAQQVNAQIRQRTDQLWVGVNRAPWKWRRHDSSRPVRYFTWSSKFQPHGGDCMYLLPERWSWANKHCLLQLSHVLCSHDVILTTQSTSTTSPISTQVAPVSNIQNKSFPKTAVTAAGVSGAALVIILIIVTAVVNRKRKRAPPVQAGDTKMAPSTETAKMAPLPSDVVEPSITADRMISEVTITPHVEICGHKQTVTD